MTTSTRNNESLWFKDAIIYEVSVRAFYDSNGDGIGDFQGLIQKLAYLDDLGVNTIWLLPFFPSPLLDDGFDVVEYCDVHPDYGTLADFKQFLKEAHRKNIRVITELILNHTSDQHPWFKRSRKAKAGSRYRDHYVWSDTPEKYKEARAMFNTGEATNWSWDPEARAFYWHRFYRHQPELNFDNPEVQLEMFKIVDFWMKLGVDGFRLPSVPFLFEEEGTSCENLPQTHLFLRKLRTHIDRNYKDRILIAEANLWPEDAAAYFGDGQECHMNFHYPLMPRMFLALRTEDSYPIIDIIEQTPATPENSQWAVFLRNHDELGLEMVTEEEKDYLFKAYANEADTKFNAGIRRRLAPLMNNDRRKIELLHAVLFSLPGTPVLYYGDEIGMGDNVYLGDRFGVRTPMQWDMNQNAGFSAANPQRLYLPIITDPVYRHESVNVATQEENHSSFLWWMKNIITMRKRLNLFGRGEMKFIESSNAKVLAFVRSYENLQIIVIANLSQFSQAASLKLTEFKGHDITEVFSQSRFLSVGGEDYSITVGPYGYYWLQVDASTKRERLEASGELPLVKTDVSWEKLFDNYNEVRALEKKVLPLFIRKCRWFGGRAKVISKVSINKSIALKVGGDTHFLTILEVQYVQRLPELYFLPLTFITTDGMTERVEHTVQSVVCRAEIQGEVGFIMDSVYDKLFRDHLLVNMEKESRVKDEGRGVLHFSASVFARIDLNKGLESRVLKSEQRNTGVTFNDKYFFKIYRKVEREMNPEVEIIKFLSEHTSFQNAPRYAGSISYHDNENNVIVFGLLQEKVENTGDAWTMSLNAVGEFYDRVIEKFSNVGPPTLLDKDSIKFEEIPPAIQEVIGRDLFQQMSKLGRRTAEMHLALASNTTNAAFAPEPFTPNYQRSMYSSLRKLVRERFNLLERSIPKLAPDVQGLARKVLSREDEILEYFSEVHRLRINSMKTRIHGDLHLGQVLITESDLVIIDFEGEPGLTFSECRLKKNPFKDVAGMMRSIHYASLSKLLLSNHYKNSNAQLLESWAEQWQHYAGHFYLGAYMERMGMNGTLTHQDQLLLRTFLLEKAIYELGFELNGRPEWTVVPLRGIEYLMRG
ncbi:MAG: maltose alpha-D-glucosyltransferase [Chryseolinea sp.]